MCSAALNAEKGGKWSSVPLMEDLAEVMNEDVFMFMLGFGRGVSAPRLEGPIKAYFEQSALERAAADAPNPGAASLKL